MSTEGYELDREIGGRLIARAVRGASVAGRRADPEENLVIGEQL